MLVEAKLSKFELFVFSKKLKQSGGTIDLITFDKVHRRGFGSLANEFRKKFTPALHKYVFMSCKLHQILIFEFDTKV